METVAGIFTMIFIVAFAIVAVGANYLKHELERHTRENGIAAHPGDVNMDVPSTHQNRQAMQRAA